MLQCPAVIFLLSRSLWAQELVVCTVPPSFLAVYIHGSWWGTNFPQGGMPPGPNAGAWRHIVVARPTRMSTLRRTYRTQEQLRKCWDKRPLNYTEIALFMPIMPVVTRGDSFWGRVALQLIVTTLVCVKLVINLPGIAIYAPEKTCCKKRPAYTRLLKWRTGCSLYWALAFHTLRV